MRQVKWIVIGVLAIGACGGDDGSTGEAVTVFAAASLTDAFTEIADEFMAGRPGVTVTLNFAGSSDLVSQIVEGAPADVFASADVANMTRLVDAGGSVGDPEVFATNAAQIITAPGNPKAISGLADLGDDDLILVACAPEVPCGRYAEQVFANAAVTVTPDSFEENVRGVVSKVVLGEADAGLVYVTDVIAAGADAAGVEIPAEVNVVAEYPIVVTAEAPNPEVGAAFVDFVRAESGQAILASYGFGPP